MNLIASAPSTCLAIAQRATAEAVNIKTTATRSWQNMLNEIVQENRWENLPLLPCQNASYRGPVRGRWGSDHGITG
jgi:hypothetical protein